VSPSAWMHLANVAFLASFVARDVLWLRLACMVGAGLLVASFLAMDPVPWDAVAWQVAFFGVHGAWSARLWAERRPVALSDDEQLLAVTLFPSLSPREVAALCRWGRWRVGGAGTELCAESAPVQRLVVLVAGEAEVVRRGERVATLAAPRFVGEVGFLLGEPASAAVRASTEVRWLEWPAADLRPWLRAHPAQQAAVQRAIGDDLARKLASGRRTDSGTSAT
jgi:hypothetical protein